VKKILLVIGVVLVGIIGIRYFFSQKENKEVAKYAEGTVNFVDTQGKVVEAERLIGQVEGWDQVKGVLTVRFDNGETRNFELKPPETMILVPEAQARSMRVIMIKSRENKHWPTAFCNGDTVTVGVKDGMVAGVDNGGKRMCGLKE
jgi:hypothetical protein